MYPPVDPILIRIGSFSLHWYGIIMTLAIFLGTLTASRFVARHGGDGAAIWDMLLWVLIPAIIGARLYYVFIQSPRDKLGQYLSNPVEILQIWNGGIHIYGALIFGAVALLLYLRLHKLPYLRYLDGIALGLALGQTIGRLGNFINQELYGPPTTLSWGLRIDQEHRVRPYDDMVQYPDSTRFHPLFLYEMLWDGIGFALLLWISRRFASRLRQGDLFLLYLIWVPFGRFWIEFLRTDSWFFPGMPFNVLHILIALLIISAAVVFFRRDRTKAAPLAATENLENTATATGTARNDESAAEHRTEAGTAQDTAPAAAGTAPEDCQEPGADAETKITGPADHYPVANKETNTSEIEKA